MANCCEAFSQQAAEINVQNMKTSLDAFSEIARQGVMDNQENARRANSINHRVSEGFETLKLLTMTAGALIGQTGMTENQAPVSPVRTATGDAIVGTEGVAAAGEAVAAQAVATSLGNLASAMVPIITAAGGVVTAQTLAALLPIVINAVGGASTPSQTQPKPPAA